ncbi:hypothetical protein [Alteromonas macleodii]|uniref:hypothetical protein n=1 Tax=Alteromonas macleodii TaxID=28108 RepID=UPI003140A54E|tara:strand:- start:180952 stop:181317 length:366 start_codon:yes stop_codon:yes gene_type:complete
MCAKTFDMQTTIFLLLANVAASFPAYSTVREASDNQKLVAYSNYWAIMERHKPDYLKLFSDFMVDGTLSSPEASKLAEYAKPLRVFQIGVPAETGDKHKLANRAIRKLARLAEKNKNKPSH